MISLFGRPEKAIVKTNHLVKLPYPKFTVHGKNRSYLKFGIDKQEECLKAGMKPNESGVGVDSEDAYAKVSFIDNNGNDKVETIVTPLGDYGKVMITFTMQSSMKR